MATLYERIGGKAAVEAAVDIFYTKVINDNRINHWFAHMDMQAQRIKQAKFLTQVFGGPSEYSGRDMAAAHTRLVERGLGDSDYDAVAENLSATLIELGVEQNLVNEIADIVESVRGVVLGRDAKPASASADDRWEPLTLLHKSLLIDGKDGDKVFRFSFRNHSNSPLRLTCAQHVDIGAEVDGKWSIRNYSPLCTSSHSSSNSNDEDGTFDLVVKVYPQGRVSRLFPSLVDGQENPTVLARWKKSHPKQLHFAKIKEEGGLLVVLAAGVASTSLLRLLQESREFHIPTLAVLSTRYEGEIVLKEELAEAVQGADWMELVHTISKPSDDWSGSKGRIDLALLHRLLAGKSPATFFVICGENGFNSTMRSMALKEFNVEDKNIHIL